MGNVIKDMIARPGLYRKLWVSLTSAALAIANGMVGMNIDEEIYSRGAQQIFDMVILLGGSVAVYLAKNEG